jgi:uncharacterized protein YdeI (YjbR/CyaY-like superfamily)
MPSNKQNPKVDAFLARTKRWKAEAEKLRALLLASELTEDMKWGKPCYTWQGTNVIILAPFKESCVLIFFKGALLKDANSILIQPGKETQASRQLRLTSLDEIKKLEPALKAYIKEATDIEKAGLKVAYKTPAELVLVEELQKKLAKNAALKKAFMALTPGRRRAYNILFSSAKQSATRDARIEKYAPWILQGKGPHDDYKKG